MKTILCLCAILAATSAYPPSRAFGDPTNQVQAKLTIEGAIALAREYCSGKLDVPADAPATVRETGGNYIVTFPQPQRPYPHGDFYAQVVMEAMTGKLISVMGSAD